MIRYGLAALVAVLLVAIGCGGGGGGGGVTVRVNGRVLSVITGGPTNPPSSVQAGGFSTSTSPADGSFGLDVPVGTTSLSVDTLGAGGVFVFTIPAAVADTDVGDLWVGPEKVTVTGTVRDATDADPIAGAQVSFGGRTGVTDANGVYTLLNVAYSSQNPEQFFGVIGQARATGFFVSDFTATRAAVGGVVTIDDVLLTPSGDANPPPGPYNIWGRVSPSGLAPGTVVTLLQNGNPVRTTSVGQDGRYFFWVAAGTYTITYRNGAFSAPDQTVTLLQQNQVEQRDVTLN